MLTRGERSDLKEFMLDVWGKDPVIDKIHVAGVLLMADALNDIAAAMNNVSSAIQGLDETFIESNRILDKLPDLDIDVDGTKLQRDILLEHMVPEGGQP